MMKKIYEMSCDHCGGGEHFFSGIMEAERQAKEWGWVIVTIKGVKKHFDTERCSQMFSA